MNASGLYHRARHLARQLSGQVEAHMRYRVCSSEDGFRVEVVPSGEAVTVRLTHWVFELEHGLSGSRSKVGRSDSFMVRPRSARGADARVDRRAV